MKRRTRLLLPVAGIATSVFLWLLWPVRVNTDVDDYESLLGEWSAQSVRHFPPRVPEHAGDTRLSYFPGFLQGGAHFQLRYRVPVEVAASTTADLEDSALLVNDGRRRRLAAAAGAVLEDMPLPPLYASDDGNWHAFPTTYTHYVLTARHGDTDGFPWNHGHITGVSISMDPPVLVHWVESW